MSFKLPLVPNENEYRLKMLWSCKMLYLSTHRSTCLDLLEVLRLWEKGIGFGLLQGQQESWVACRVSGSQCQTQWAHHHENDSYIPYKRNSIGCELDEVNLQ